MSDFSESKAGQREALELFEQSLDQPVHNRYEWLAVQCKDQPDLLADVLKLVAADETADGILDRSALRHVLTGPGDRAGPFELLEEIGAGGAGRVFRARRADGEFDQEVAVKLFEVQRLPTEFLKRFHAERQILATLEHPGIARLIDGGTTQHGVPFVAMELIRGDVITTYCAKQKLDIASRLALFQRVCDALEMAHARGIIHRDIKPGNVLVGEDGEPKIIDFGIAKVMDPTAFGLPAADRTLTRFQALTPEYASPEQVRGGAVNQATDVYALGVLLYEMLTGVRPYQISTLTPVEVEQTVCHTIPDDPSQRVARRRSAPPLGLTDAAQLTRQLRGDVDRIVMTALKKEPEQRYRSAGAFSRDIERYLSGYPVRARGASRLYRAGKFFQRNRSVCIAASVVFLALSAALLSVTRSATQIRLEAQRTEVAREFLIEMISRSDPFDSGGDKTIASAVEESILFIDSRFSDQPDIEAELRYTIGAALYSQAKYELAREQTEHALAYFREFGPPRKEALARAVLARIHWYDTAYEEARAQYKAAIALVVDDDSEASKTTYAELLGDLAGLLPYLDQQDEGIRLAQEALALIADGVTISVRNHAVTYNNLAICYDANEQHAEAIEAYEKAISFHRQVSAAHPDLAIALANLAQTYELVDDMPLALARVEEGYQMIRDILGEEHPETLLIRHNLGSLQINAKKYAQAAENLTAVAHGAMTGYGPEHVYTGRFHHKVAIVRFELKEFAVAREYAERARQIYAVNEDVPEPWAEGLRTLDEQLFEALETD
ncbi:MAG: protein kinase [Gammaproteobacteria bacterium]